MEIVIATVVVYLVGAVIMYDPRQTSRSRRLRRALLWPVVLLTYALGVLGTLAMIYGIVIVAGLGEVRFLQWLAGLIAVIGLAGVLAWAGILRGLFFITGEENRS